MLKLRRVIQDAHSQPEVDPYSVRHGYESWKSKAVSPDGTANREFFLDIRPAHSEFLVRYVLDLEEGKNLTKGTKKGSRSYVHLINTAIRLRVIFRLLKEHTGRANLDFTEEEIINLFNGMRTGKIQTSKGKPYKSTGNYCNVFKSFWHYYMRIMKKQGELIADITEDLDTAFDEKPKWSFFSLEGVKKMANLTNLEYKAILLFLFDSGVRAPKEMMNVRVKDLTPIPNSQNLYLTVRDETSKTFGRKIKLMICSQTIKDYIQAGQLKPDDFLFFKNPETYARTLRHLGYSALGYGQKKEAPRKGGGKPHINIINGISMYDFRHNSVCHYLPLYQSETQLMYRYGWNDSHYIRYYSEWLGMRDTIKEENMLIDTTKTEIEQQLEQEKRAKELLQEQLEAQRQEMVAIKEQIAQSQIRDEFILKMIKSLTEKGKINNVVDVVKENGLVGELATLK